MTIQEILKWRQEQKGMNQLLGISVDRLHEGYAEASLAVDEKTLNPMGMAHGGTVFTLCDVAAGSAAAARGIVAVTLDSSIDYYKSAPCGDVLTAVATERKHGKTISVFHVEVRNQDDVRIAEARFNMYYTQKKVEDLL